MTFSVRRWASKVAALFSFLHALLEKRIGDVPPSPGEGPAELEPQAHHETASAPMAMTERTGRISRILRPLLASGDPVPLIPAEQCDERFSRLLSNRYATRPEVVASLADGVLAEVEDGRRQHGIGAAFHHALVKMLQITHAA